MICAKCRQSPASWRCRTCGLDHCDQCHRPCETCGVKTCPFCEGEECGVCQTEWLAHCRQQQQISFARYWRDWHLLDPEATREEIFEQWKSIKGLITDWTLAEFDEDVEEVEPNQFMSLLNKIDWLRLGF